MRIPPEERARRGREAYASQFGIAPEDVDGWFTERFGERFGEEAVNAAAGAWIDDELSLRDRSLIVVAALIVQGEVGDRLSGHVRWAVEHGVARAELEALASLLAVYAGYPRAAAGLEVVRGELDRIEGGTT